MTNKSPVDTGEKQPSLSIGWAIWGIAALFYGYEFVHRILPAAMLPELKLAFFASDTALSTLTAIYFWTYALFQIPAGILIDRYGSRMLLTTASLIVTVGSFLLFFSPDINTAYFSRFLVGMGSAFAFVGCLKLGREWISQASFPLVVGFTSLSGQIAAMLGNHPLASLVDLQGWKSTVLLISIIGALITLTLALVIRNKDNFKPRSPSKSHYIFLEYLSSVVRQKQTWLIAIYGCLLVSPIVTLGEFWGIHYFQSKYLLSRPDAALLNSSIFMGIALGGPLIGWLSKLYPHYLSIMRISTALASCCLVTILLNDTLSYTALIALLLIYGMMSSNMLLCFTLVNQQNSSDHQATAIGFTNTIIMFGGAFFPVVIGLMLDHLSKFSLSHLVPHSVRDLENSLLILPIALVIALIVTLFIKQKTE